MDPVSDEDAAIADRTNEGAEGLLVAKPRLIHERSQHSVLLVVDAEAGSTTSMSCGRA